MVNSYYVGAEHLSKSAPVCAKLAVYGVDCYIIIENTRS